MLSHLGGIRTVPAIHIVFHRKTQQVTLAEVNEGQRSDGLSSSRLSNNSARTAIREVDRRDGDLVKVSAKFLP